MSMKKKKSNVTRNKFLLCFKPVVLELQSKIKSCSNNYNLFNYMKISMIHESDSKILDRNGGTPKRTLSKIIKAVLFQTSMSMKVRDRKIRQNSLRSMSNLSTSTDDSNKAKSINQAAEESTSSPRIIRESNTNLTSISSHNSGLYLVLVSLTMTILWGKLCAVLLTSTWLYFDLRHRKTLKQRSENDVMSPEMTMMRSKEYKKRVIMEGLLERNHHHHQHHHHHDTNGSSNKLEVALNSLREKT